MHLSTPEDARYWQELSAQRRAEKVQIAGSAITQSAVRMLQPGQSFVCPSSPLRASPLGFFYPLRKAGFDLRADLLKKLSDRTKIANIITSKTGSEILYNPSLRTASLDAFCFLASICSF